MWAEAAALNRIWWFACKRVSRVKCKKNISLFIVAFLIFFDTPHISKHLYIVQLVSVVLNRAVNIWKEMLRGNEKGRKQTEWEYAVGFPQKNCYSIEHKTSSSDELKKTAPGSSLLCISRFSLGFYVFMLNFTEFLFYMQCLGGTMIQRESPNPPPPKQMKQLIQPFIPSKK